MDERLQQYWAWNDQNRDDSAPPLRKVNAGQPNQETNADDFLDYDNDYLNDRSYTSSDDSPIMSYRYDKYKRLQPYVAGKRVDLRERRFSFNGLSKFLFCSAMIFFCVIMYIPVYNKAKHQVAKGVVIGWSIDTNRDTKIYVQPHNVTTIHQPQSLCKRRGSDKLTLLIIVSSATTNFEQRNAIRESWANYENFEKISKLFQEIKEKYKHYNYTYDLYPLPEVANTTTYEVRKPKVRGHSVNVVKRSISFGSLIPELAAALKENIKSLKTEEDVQEKRFEDSNDLVMPEFDMEKELGEPTNQDYYLDYASNVMKIPPNGDQESPDLGKLLTILKGKRPFTEAAVSTDNKQQVPESGPGVEGGVESDSAQGQPIFKLVFLLGLPGVDNDSLIQGRIEEEIVKYSDIIQEGFVDSYNNLTLKSIMMLKWVVNHCNDSVRYIMKTDDDMFVNIPNLVEVLKNKSKELSSKGPKGSEYFLIGDLIYGARPISDSNNKWYSPRYMYGGRVYPRYLSGTGYALTPRTAEALYHAALRTPYFHLEDVYITGLCAARAVPHIKPVDAPGFSYRLAPPGDPCTLYTDVTSHRVPHTAMASLEMALQNDTVIDICERIRLTKLRRERLRPKKIPRKVLLHH